MEPTDLTLQILREIRDELKSSNARHDARFEQVNTRLDDMRAESNERFEQARVESNARFEVIETALRESARNLAEVSNWLAG